MNFGTFLTLEFWIGVVVVGILINLVSAYLKGPVDRAGSAAWGWWASRSRQKKEATERVIQTLSREPGALEALRVTMTVSFFVSLSFLMLAVAVLIGALAIAAISDPQTLKGDAPVGALPTGGKWFLGLGALGALLLLMGLQVSSAAIDQAYVVREAFKRKAGE